MAFAAFVAFGPATATAVPATGTIAVKFGSVEINLTPAEWAELSRQGSSAALALHRETIRTGLRTGPIQRDNAELVAADARLEAASLRRRDALTVAQGGVV